MPVAIQVYTGPKSIKIYYKKISYCVQIGLKMCSVELTKLQGSWGNVTTLMSTVTTLMRSNNRRMLLLQHA